MANVPLPEYAPELDVARPEWPLCSWNPEAELDAEVDMWLDTWRKGLSFPEVTSVEGMEPLPATQVKESLQPAPALAMLELPWHSCSHDAELDADGDTRHNGQSWSKHNRSQDAELDAEAGTPLSNQRWPWHGWRPESGAELDTGCHGQRSLGVTSGNGMQTLSAHSGKEFPEPAPSLAMTAGWPSLPSDEELQRCDSQLQPDLPAISSEKELQQFDSEPGFPDIPSEQGMQRQDLQIQPGLQGNSSEQESQERKLPIELGISGVPPDQKRHHHDLELGPGFPEFHPQGCGQIQLELVIPSLVRRDAGEPQFDAQLALGETLSDEGAESPSTRAWADPAGSGVGTRLQRDTQFSDLCESLHSVPDYMLLFEELIDPSATLALQGGPDAPSTRTQQIEGETSRMIVQEDDPGLPDGRTRYEDPIPNALIQHSPSPYATGPSTVPTASIYSSARPTSLTAGASFETERLKHCARQSGTTRQAESSGQAGPFNRSARSLNPGRISRVAPSQLNIGVRSVRATPEPGSLAHRLAGVLSSISGKAQAKIGAHGCLGRGNGEMHYGSTAMQAHTEPHRGSDAMRSKGMLHSTIASIGTTGQLRSASTAIGTNGELHSAGAAIGINEELHSAGGAIGTDGELRPSESGRSDHTPRGASQGRNSEAQLCEKVIGESVSGPSGQSQEAASKSHEASTRKSWMLGGTEAAVASSCMLRGTEAALSGPCMLGGTEAAPCGSCMSPSTESVGAGVVTMAGGGRKRKGDKETSTDQGLDGVYGLEPWQQRKTAEVRCEQHSETERRAQQKGSKGPMKMRPVPPEREDERRTAGDSELVQWVQETGAKGPIKVRHRILESENEWERGGDKERITDADGLVPFVCKPVLQRQQEPGAVNPMALRARTDSRFQRVILRQLVQLATAYSTNQEARACKLLLTLRKAASPEGATVQRLAHYAVLALQERFEPGEPQAHPELSPEMFASLVERAQRGTHATWGKFSEVAMTRSLAQALVGKPRVHIIAITSFIVPDWGELFTTLASIPGLKPHIKITFLNTYRGPMDPSLVPGIQTEYSVLVQQVEQAGRVVGLHVESKQVLVPAMGLHAALSAVNLDNSEAVGLVAWVTLMELPDESVLRHNPRDAVLKWIKGISPLVFTMVEVDANHNSPFFLARFNQVLRTASTMLDNLEHTVHCQTADVDPAVRGSMEQMMLQVISNCVAREGLSRLDRVESVAQWRERMRMMGFKEERYSENMFSALRRASIHPAMDVLDIDGMASLRWKGAPLVFAGTWVS